MHITDLLPELHARIASNLPSGDVARYRSASKSTAFAPDRLTPYDPLTAEAIRRKDNFGRLVRHVRRENIGYAGLEKALADIPAGAGENAVGHFLEPLSKDAPNVAAMRAALADIRNGRRIAASPNPSAAMPEYLSGTMRRLKEAVLLADPKTPRTALFMLAERTIDADAQIRLLSHPRTSKFVHRQVAKIPVDARVRRFLLEDSRTDDQVLANLATTATTPDELDEVLNHKKNGLHSLRAISMQAEGMLTNEICAKRDRIALQIALDPRSDGDTLRDIVSLYSTQVIPQVVRSAIAENSNSRLGTLVALALDANDPVERKSLIRHPSLAPSQDPAYAWQYNSLTGMLAESVTGSEELAMLARLPQLNYRVANTLAEKLRATTL